MQKINPQTIWNCTKTELQNLLDSGYLKPRCDIIRFYVPSFSYYKDSRFCPSTNEFPTISVTGNACALNCKHCGGRVLETMHPAIDPEQLWNLGLKLKNDGARGVLVSGGCLPDGSVPLDDFTPVLARFKKELELTVFVHTGVISFSTALALKKAGVDAALIDILGSRQTALQALNLDVQVEDYMQSLLALDNAGLKVVPHILVGLNNGELDSEFHALEIISQTIKPAAVVIIAFMPIRGTEMGQTLPPSSLDIVRVVSAARIMFPKAPLALGCMRPKGKLRSEIDILALKAGVDAIAFPSPEAIDYAKCKGYQSIFSSSCCAQMYLDVV